MSIDGRRIAAAVEDGQRLAAVAHVEAMAVQVDPHQPVQVDAAGRPLGRVEGVDEGVIAGAVVERVGEPPVRARRPGDRRATHDVPDLAGVDDRLALEAARTQVVQSHEVAGRIVRREVLDEVEQGAVRRDRVEREVAAQRDRLAESKPACPDERERGARLREGGAGTDEHEPPPVRGEAARRAVVGDRGDGETPTNEPVHPDTSTALVDLGDHCAPSGTQRHVARIRSGHRNALRPDLDPEDGQPIGLRDRGERGAGEEEHEDEERQSCHALCTEVRGREVPHLRVGPCATGPGRW